MSRPKITFLMVAYNAERTIEKAIKSVLAQTEENITLRVRNNGSTDSTEKILRSLAQHDARIKIYYNQVNNYEDEKGSFTRDGVLRWWPLDDPAQLGEYISIIDSDDWLSPDFAHTMYTAAEKVHADIAVCGCSIMISDTAKYGERLPPPIVTENLKDESERITNFFPFLYNTLRTWWAKLFRREFFLRSYDAMWKTVGGNYADIVDTIVMLDYFTQCRGFAGVSQALYHFRHSSGSNYNKRYPSRLRAFEAEALYQHGKHLLEVFSADSPQNSQFLLDVHMTYLAESLGCLTVAHKDMTSQWELSWIACLLGNRILSGFYEQEQFQVRKFVNENAEEYTKAVMERNPNHYFIYASFLARLHYIKVTLAQNPNHPLLYPILLGCLYDPENRNRLGEELLERIVVSPEFLECARSMLVYQKWESRANPLSPYILFNKLQHQLNVKTEPLEQQLEQSLINRDYESVCDLVNQISMENVLNRNAMYCRIQMLVLTEELELACILAGTVRILWPVDIEMQELCWQVFHLAEMQKTDR